MKQLFLEVARNWEALARQQDMIGVNGPHTANLVYDTATNSAEQPRSSPSAASSGGALA